MTQIIPINKADPGFLKMFSELTDGSKSKEEITDAYSKWDNYEEMVKLYAPNRPIVGAKAFNAQYGKRDKDIKILDVGAGTGLAAEQLVKLGFTNIDALDPSENLVKKALEKNIYKKWYKAYLCKDRLPIDDNVYDVIYSVGVFSAGAAKEDCLEELIRILKPGGQVMIITGEKYLDNPYMSNFEPRMNELEKMGVLIRRNRDVLPYYTADENGPMNGLSIVLEKPSQ